MIYYKLLWGAAALVGSAHLLMFTFDPNYPNGLAAVVCGLACAMTFNQAWK